jgi:hypothetical protein
MAVADQQALRDFPSDAKISLRLQENKRIEVLEFGTVANPKPTQVSLAGFAAPTCQLRITAVDGSRRSLLLGSTDGWTVRGGEEEEEEGQKSILLFQPAETKPQSWKLDIRDSDHPIVYVDKRIPDARTWAKADPIFQAAVLPAVIRQIFEYILCLQGAKDIEWIQQWLRWADAVMPGSLPPLNGAMKERTEYIDALLDSFCFNHELADKLLRSFTQSGSST